MVVVTDVRVVGLSADRLRVALRVGDVTLEVPLADIHQAEQYGDRRGVEGEGATQALTPRVVQSRIRGGESAEQVARSGSWPVEVVRKYEGPVLAEREHHAAAARRALVDGRVVEELVAAHLGQPVAALDWDAWLVEPGQWDVRAAAAGCSLVLRWASGTQTVTASDEAGRRALRPHAPQDALTAVLRPLSVKDSGSATAAPEQPKVRRPRAEVPGWADISRQVSGRDVSRPQ